MKGRDKCQKSRRAQCSDRTRREKAPASSKECGENCPNAEQRRERSPQVQREHIAGKRKAFVAAIAT